MSGHQEYLEAPYVQASQQEAAYEMWLEKNPHLDPEEDHWEAFEEWQADQYPEDDEPYYDEEGLDE